MFFMMTYGLLNFACFALAYFDTPGWRPKFHYYHWGTGLRRDPMPRRHVPDGRHDTGISLGVAILLVLWIWSREVKTNWGTGLMPSRIKMLSSCGARRTIRQHHENVWPKYLLMGATCALTAVKLLVDSCTNLGEDTEVFSSAALSKATTAKTFIVCGSALRISTP